MLTLVVEMKNLWSQKVSHVIVVTLDMLNEWFLQDHDCSKMGIKFSKEIKGEIGRKIWGDSSLPIQIKKETMKWTNHCCVASVRACKSRHHLVIKYPYSTLHMIDDSPNWTAKKLFKQNHLCHIQWEVLHLNDIIMLLVSKSASCKDSLDPQKSLFFISQSIIYFLQLQKGVVLWNYMHL